MDFEYWTLCEGLSVNRTIAGWIRRYLKYGIIAAVAMFGLIQFVPYGHAHTNPPVVQEPQWDSPQTRQLAMQACGACHSNETTWPWYSKLAPVSWLVQHDVEEGRATLNFSDINQHQREANHAARAVQNGSMPVNYYTWIHSDAKLSDQEKQALIDGFEATFGSGSHPATQPVGATVSDQQDGLTAE